MKPFLTKPFSTNVGLNGWLLMPNLVDLVNFHFLYVTQFELLDQIWLIYGPESIRQKLIRPVLVEMLHAFSDYSGGSLNRPSQKWTTSLKWTNTRVHQLPHLFNVHLCSIESVYTWHLKCISSSSVDLHSSHLCKVLAYIFSQKLRELWCQVIWNMPYNHVF